MEYEQNFKFSRKVKFSQMFQPAQMFCFTISGLVFVFLFSLLVSTSYTFELSFKQEQSSHAREREIKNSQIIYVHASCMLGGGFRIACVEFRVYEFCIVINSQSRAHFRLILLSSTIIAFFCICVPFALLFVASFQQFERQQQHEQKNQIK